MKVAEWAEMTGNYVAVKKVALSVYLTELMKAELRVAWMVG